jgi:hypothetical protein
MEKPLEHSAFTSTTAGHLIGIAILSAFGTSQPVHAAPSIGSTAQPVTASIGRQK